MHGCSLAAPRGAGSSGHADLWRAGQMLSHRGPGLHSIWVMLPVYVTRIRTQSLFSACVYELSHAPGYEDGV